MSTTDLKNRKTFESISMDWLDTVKIRSKPSTYSKYNELLNKQIIPDIGHIDISELNTTLLSEFVLNKCENGRLDGNGGLSAKSVQDIISIVNLVMKFARSENYNVNGNICLLRPKRNKNEVKILDISEQKRLEKYLLDNLNLKTLGILLTLYTGFRIGEICALKRKNIDFNSGVINVENTLIRVKNIDKHSKEKTKVIIDSPKSKNSKRFIPIPDFLYVILKKHIYNLPDEAFILTGEIKKFVEPRTYENNFKKYLKEAKVEQINFHALRHTFATRAIEANFDVKTLSEILGHSDVNITLSIYVHSSIQLKRENMKKLKLCCSA